MTLFHRSITTALRQNTAVWTPTLLSSIRPAADSLFHVSIDVSDSPYIISSYTSPGQYLQIRVPQAQRPTYLAIASPPSQTTGVFEFLVKAVEGSTAEALCCMRKGEVVEVTPAMGNGFDIHRISPPLDFPSVFIFATGSGISPIRSLIESGFGADRRHDVRLYYGARNLQRMAYQDRFKQWEESGVNIVPVLSQPDDSWTGERGYVQAAFGRAKKNYSPQGTGIVLCGQKQMAEAQGSLGYWGYWDFGDALLADGVSIKRILKNF